MCFVVIFFRKKWPFKIRTALKESLTNVVSELLIKNLQGSSFVILNKSLWSLKPSTTYDTNDFLKNLKAKLLLCLIF